MKKVRGQRKQGILKTELNRKKVPLSFLGILKTLIQVI